ncbi:MAG: glutamate racemase [Desulfobulbaceae bacterium]|nr:glutamate racemase [Desulfobulbaceae bacterium]HIJ79192.1 glutamate racemase [Deltaproteobacteria bacterium]
MIGIFDSGVGGMTVARAIEQRLPDYRTVYFGDLARSPYGSKSEETIIAYARQNTEFLLAQGAKVIVIACNTAASVASEILTREFAVPIFEVISPAVDKAVAASRSGAIGVIGTRATVRSGIYEKKITGQNPQCRVVSQACPLLVPLVEEGWFNKRETKMILRRYLHPIRLKNVDTLVLGCTHYPLLKNLIQPRIGKRVTVIDSAEAVAAGLAKFLEENPEVEASLSHEGENLYYVSDITEAAADIAKRVFGRPIDLQKISGETFC